MCNCSGTIVLVIDCGRPRTNQHIVNVEQETRIRIWILSVSSLVDWCKSHKVHAVLLLLLLLGGAGGGAATHVLFFVTAGAQSQLGFSIHQKLSSLLSKALGRQTDAVDLGTIEMQSQHTRLVDNL